MTVRLLPSDVVAESAPMVDVISAVEDAFDAYERGRVQMPAKSYVTLDQYEGDFRSMPAYIDAGDWDGAGIKWVNVHPRNPDKHDLPTVMGTMIYSDPETALPLAFLDGTSVTMKRTGAAAAVATDHLAVEDASTLGIVGAGIQSYTQVDAITEVRPIREIVVADPDDDRVDEFVDTYDEEFDVKRGSTSEAASADVLSTVTPVREPIVSLEDVGERTHINAMGADAEGKQELETDIPLESTLVIDDHAQTTHSGEINVPYSRGDLTDDDIYAELGEIVAGVKAGRETRDGITVFDSTGLAIQDVATAHVVYETAVENGDGTELDLLNLS
ncbi:ornithine cyclodeaminase family protein [Natrarchaeobius chitinivorans]|uniref:Alanine dehydrogenase n=1 Tax=Natrarchaeobius chitinivorans TaxID=1679083 RepID=A0A3N6LLJ6_NATCH|nr:ornithine cyclodeaminase family protein [Natrarchaeobius chitinivorans]RQG89728.1 ornithine cyclodeaminase family protein [Natrarchaeobius chitinivorans]